VVTAREGAEKRLIAYVSGSDSLPSESDLHKFARKFLPDYMVPSEFIVLPRLPLSANGKLNRRALPRPENRRAGHVAELDMPQSEAERGVAKAWCEVLRVDQVGLHQNFFELGGNSLMLLPLQHRLQRFLERPIPLTALFRAPTVHLLAELLTAEPEANAEKQATPDITRVERSTNAARMREARSQHRASARQDRRDV